MKNKIKKLSLITMAVAVIILAFFTVFSMNDMFTTIFANASENFVRESSEVEKPDEKIYCNATIDDEFLPGSVMVVLDKRISDYHGLPEEFYSSLFRGIEYTDIEDLSDYGEAVKNNNKLKNHLEQIDFR